MVTRPDAGFVMFTVGACVSRLTIYDWISCWPKRSVARTCRVFDPSLNWTLNEKLPALSAVVEPSSNRPSIPVSNAREMPGFVVPARVLPGVFVTSVPSANDTGAGES